MGKETYSMGGQIGLYDYDYAFTSFWAYVLGSIHLKKSEIYGNSINNSHKKQTPEVFYDLSSTNMFLHSMVVLKSS